MIRYKVVKVEGDKLVSVVADGDLKVAYEVGKLTTAPIGGLMVFKDIYYAQRFQNQKANQLIFSCEVEVPVRLCGAKMTTPCSLKNAISYWKTPKQRFERVWPAGTEAYRVVKLLEMVQG